MPQVVTLQPVLLLPAAALSLNTGPVFKNVPISHLDTEILDNRVQFEIYRSYPLIKLFLFHGKEKTLEYSR